jgi:hypothetical protein
MHEVFLESIRWVNLPFTVLLGFIVLYWLLVVLGALDINLFGPAETDAHLEGDTHADLHSDGDAPLPGDTPHLPGDKHLSLAKEGDAGSEMGFLSHALAFLNVGRVPVMFIMSVLVLSLWLGSMLYNRYLTDGLPLRALALLLPNFLVSLVVTRYVTLPFRPIFRVLSLEDEKHVQIIGQRCVIVTSEATAEFGQAEVKTDGAPVLLNVRTLNDARLVKGDFAVVVRTDDERRFFYVVPLPDFQIPTQSH